MILRRSRLEGGRGSSRIAARLCARRLLSGGVRGWARFRGRGFARRSGAAHFAEEQDFDLKIAAIVVIRNMSPMRTSRAAWRLAVGLDSAEFTGARGQGSGLEESGGPEPFIDAYGVMDWSIFFREDS